MDNNFEITLYSEETADSFIANLHRKKTEYGTITLPPDDMNLAYGIKNSDFFLTFSGKTSMEGKEGYHKRFYDVMTDEGCFTVVVQADAYQVYHNNISIKTDPFGVAHKYRSISDAVKFYESQVFSEHFKSIIDVSIFDYENKIHKKILNKYKRLYDIPIYEYCISDDEKRKRIADIILSEIKAGRKYNLSEINLTYGIYDSEKDIFVCDISQSSFKNSIKASELAVLTKDVDFSVFSETTTHTVKKIDIPENFRSYEKYIKEAVICYMTVPNWIKYMDTRRNMIEKKKQINSEYVYNFIESLI